MRRVKSIKSGLRGTVLENTGNGWITVMFDDLTDPVDMWAPLTRGVIEYVTAPVPGSAYDYRCDCSVPDCPHHGDMREDGDLVVAPKEHTMTRIRINRHGRELTESRTFASLSRARHYAAGQVTSAPAIVADDWGTEYAVHEGVVLTVGGAHVRDLFPDVPE